MAIESAAVSHPSFGPATHLALGLGVLALARTLALLRAATVELGPTLFAEEPRSLLRALRLALVAAAALGLALTWTPGTPGGLASGALIAVAAALTWVTPTSASQRYCEHGVRRGFDARRFEELEEWRLAGEHLRWKLEGEWISCRVPTQMHAELRAKLATLNAERESRFA